MVMNFLPRQALSCLNLCLLCEEACSVYSAFCAAYLVHLGLDAPSDYILIRLTFTYIEFCSYSGSSVANKVEIGKLG